jgi:hypothetical protein
MNYARTAWHRTDYGLEELAVMCDVEAQTVAKWLHVKPDGTSLPGAARNGPNGIGFVKFAHALGVTPDELMHANLTDFAQPRTRTAHLSIDAPLTVGAGVGSGPDGRLLDTTALTVVEGWLQRLVVAAVHEALRAVPAPRASETDDHDDHDDHDEE